MCQTYPYPTSRTYPGIPTPEAIELPILEYVAGGQEYVFGTSTGQWQTTLS